MLNVFLLKNTAIKIMPRPKLTITCLNHKSKQTNDIKKCSQVVAQAIQLMKVTA